MSAERNFTDQDYELLSAYLDGALTAAERAALETRLQTDDGLRQELDVLRQTVNLVRALPPLKAPRNFALTPSMVRPRSTRWLIFPTSAAFSTLLAAAATLLILLGAGMLLLQNNPAGAPSFGAQPVALQQESTSQIAFAPTESPPSEKTAERDLQRAQETAAANDLLVLTDPPSLSPAAANGAAVPETSSTSPIQPPQATAPEAPASVTSDGLGYTTASQPTLDEETSQALQSAAPADSTLYFAATMPPPSLPPVAPGAADTSAQTGGSDQQDANAQSSAAAEIMSDQVAATPSVAQLGTENLGTFGLLTATMPAVEQFAAVPSDTPTARPTLAPTMTMTVTASLTPAPTQTPIPTSAQDGRTTASPSAPVDLLTWGALILGVLLLIVAIATTITRRRS